MSYSFRKMRINKIFAGAPCGWCTHALVIGEDGAICEACDTPHHLECWLRENGCSTERCINYVLPALPATTPLQADPGQDAPPNSRLCPNCNKWIALNSRVCAICNTFLGATGREQYERITLREAKQALTYGIIAFLCCPPIAGYYAIKNANTAIDIIDANAEYQGRGMAVAGKVLGIIAIVVWVLGLLIRLASIR
ncbi:MAG TPA: RING finger protein [Blastocatellia bacterium]|nr:RING finger protein [Blastocatellia bacterium]